MSLNTETFHVLLVEDDVVDIENVKREFKKLSAPIEFHVARDGIEALNKLRGKNGEEKLSSLPQLVILDINLPRMDGVEFLKKIRADQELKYLTVYILTTAYTSRDKVATRELNVAGVIVKPLQYEDIFRLYWSILGVPE